MGGGKEDHCRLVLVAVAAVAGDKVVVGSEMRIDRIDIRQGYKNRKALVERA